MALVLEPKSTTAQQRKSAQPLPGRPESDSHQHILAAHCHPTSLAVGSGDLESPERANPSTTASPVLMEAPRWPPLASSAGQSWANWSNPWSHASSTGIPPSHWSGPSRCSRPSPSRPSDVLSSRCTRHPAKQQRRARTATPSIKSNKAEDLFDAGQT